MSVVEITFHTDVRATAVPYRASDTPAGARASV